jgi:hypothetical protein
VQHRVAQCVHAAHVADVGTLLAGTAAAAAAVLGATLIPLKLRHSRSKLLMAVPVGFTASPRCTLPSFNANLTRDAGIKLHRI